MKSLLWLIFTHPPPHRFSMKWYGFFCVKYINLFYNGDNSGRPLNYKHARPFIKIGLLHVYLRPWMRHSPNPAVAARKNFFIFPTFLPQRIHQKLLITLWFSNMWIYSPPAWKLHCSPCRLYGPTYRSSSHRPINRPIYTSCMRRLCEFRIFENCYTHIC